MKQRPLFIVCLTTVSIAQTKQRRNMNNLINTDLESLWKEADMA
jgi:hypothetical protein